MANKITKISLTNQKISGRGGSTLFPRYVVQTKFYEVITFVFNGLDIFNTKGLQLQQFMKQVIAFFLMVQICRLQGLTKEKKTNLISSIRKQSGRNGFIASDKAIFQEAIDRSAFCGLNIILMC